MVLTNSPKCVRCGSRLSLRMSDGRYVCPVCGAVYILREKGAADIFAETEEPAAIVLRGASRFSPRDWPPAVLDVMVRDTRDKALLQVLQAAKEQVCFEERETEIGYLVSATLRVVPKEYVFR